MTFRRSLTVKAAVLDARSLGTWRRLAAMNRPAALERSLGMPHFQGRGLCAGGPPPQMAQVFAPVL